MTPVPGNQYTVCCFPPIIGRCLEVDHHTRTAKLIHVDGLDRFGWDELAPASSYDPSDNATRKGARAR